MGSWPVSARDHTCDHWRYYFVNAQMLCERFAQSAERFPLVLRLLSPPRFHRSRYAVWQLRSTGIAAIAGACILAVVGFLTLFAHQ
jgi:hypothetical protein